ncbi:MAG: flagellar basal body-associated FliL family protein [Lachnospiraceae bacterium]|nr:flagellar basal body-associated FliL family protein [Lachnospiraceae bacterium]
MKKNFISILILGCTLINIVLSAITMFSVVSTNQKTAAIVTDVAQVLDIELGGTETEEKEYNVPIENIVTYSISEEMMVELKPDAEGKRHFCSVTVFFSMDSKHKDYKKYGATIGDNELILKSIVSETFQQYTMDEARANQDEISAEILKKVQAKYGDSEFVFDVSFSDIMFQ